MRSYIRLLFGGQIFLHNNNQIGFYGISTLVGYLMADPLYTYILDTYDLLTHVVDNIFIRACALYCTVFKYYNQTQIILFIIDHLFAHI